MAGRPRDRINAEWGRLVQGDASQDVWQLHDFLHGQAARMERQKQRPEWETTLRLLAATAVEAEHLHAVALLFDEWGVRCDRLMASNALSASQFLPHGRPKGLLNLALATESEDLAVLVAEHVEGVAKDFCLKQAAALGFTEVMEMLISQHGADAAVLLHAPEGQHAPICHAVMTGDCAMATLLLNLHRDRQLDGGSVLERPCSHAPERLLLFHAIKAGADVPIVACLIELGADPRRVMDRPPLQAHQLAAAFGRPAIMEYLIFAVGLDPHIIYKPRRRLLHLVCGASDFGPGDDTTGALPVVQFLVERCGLSMTVVASGRTPHERAARTGLIATCAYLKRRLGLPVRRYIRCRSKDFVMLRFVDRDRFCNYLPGHADEGRGGAPAGGGGGGGGTRRQ